MRLLINYTRSVPPQEKGRDEVSEYWTREGEDYKNVLHEKSDDDERQVLVIQGNYTENDLPKRIAEVVSQLAESSKVGVLYHLSGADPDYEKDIRSELPDIECAFIHNYSGGDSTYHLYEKLAQAGRSEDDFKEEFDAVWDRYAPDEDLETKLDLLHRCLTPQGAKAVLDEGTIHRQHVKVLAGYDSAKAATTSEYVNALTTLRKQVLGN